MFTKIKNLVQEKEWLAVFIISLILSLIIFGNGLKGDFVFDDVAVVKNRGDLKDSSFFLNLFVSPYHQNMPKTGLYRPLTMATYAINHYLGGSTGSGQGGSAFGFHLVNLLIHAFNSFLVFWLVSFFLKSKQMAYASFFLFLTHPIHTEAVTSIVGRAELLAFFWGMATIYFFVKKYKLLAGLSFLLALWSKETALMVLPALLYLDVYFNNQKTWLSIKRLFFLAIPAGIYVVFRHIALGQYFLGDITTTIVENQLKFAGFFERIFTALKVLAMYAERLVWPMHLSADYSYRRIALVGNIFKSSEAILGLFLLAGLIYLAIKYRKANVLSQPVTNHQLPITSLGLGAALFLFPYLMISNLIMPVGTIMGERLMYLPSLGFVILLSFFLGQILNIFLKNNRPEVQREHQSLSAENDWFVHRSLLRFSLIILLAAFVVFYNVLTITRNNVWKDSRTLFTATVKESPHSLITRTALAGVHIKANEWEEAKRELELAKNIHEDNSHLQNLLGIVADHEGDPVLAESRFLRSITLNSDAINSYINLAELYFKYGEYAQAAGNLLKVIEFYPVAEYVVRYAYAQIALENPDEAIRVLNKYAGGNLKHPDFSAVIGTAYFVKKDYQQALVYLRNARQLGNQLPDIEKMIEIAEKQSK